MKSRRSHHRSAPACRRSHNRHLHIQKQTWSIYIRLDVRNQRQTCVRLKAVLLHNPTLEVCPKQDIVLVQLLRKQGDLQNESKQSNPPKWKRMRAPYHMCGACAARASCKHETAVLRCQFWMEKTSSVAWPTAFHKQYWVRTTSYQSENPFNLLTHLLVCFSPGHDPQIRRRSLYSGLQFLPTDRIDGENRYRWAKLILKKIKYTLDAQFIYNLRWTWFVIDLLSRKK